MATQLLMRRVTADTYQRMMAGEFVNEYKREERGVGETWDVLARILAHGFIESPQTHALAILGGRTVPGSPGFGARALSPHQVAEASGLLNVFVDGEIERRHRRLDFTGAQGGGTDGAPVISVEDCIRAFRCLRKFYAKAAIHGEGMVLLFAEAASATQEGQ
ncbi:hypothetical protein ACF1AL_06925 [Streptomyces sp. NPDC014801]|uniref:hypothetical protein n=1 Tax=Streptomyces sp. NPDC014801 TaxID=3364916 RepID=UPI0036F6BAF7